MLPENFPIKGIHVIESVILTDCRFNNRDRGDESLRLIATDYRPHIRTGIDRGKISSSPDIGPQMIIKPVTSMFQRGNLFDRTHTTFSVDNLISD